MPNTLITGDFVANKRITVPSPQEKGTLFEHTFTHTFSATFNYTNVDMLALGVLPAGCTIVDAVLMSPSGATNVVDVGIMTGAHGDPIGSRTVDDQLFDGVALAAAGTRTVNQPDLFTLTPVDYDRTIGLIATAANIASAATVSLSVTFKVGPRAA